jgi:hypothetical protein
MTACKNVDDGSSDINSTPSSMQEYNVSSVTRIWSGMKQCSSSTCVWERTNACRILVGKLKSRPVGKPRCRWWHNIKMGLKEIGWEGMDWIHLA